MTVTPEELEAGAKALCHPSMVPNHGLDTYWDTLPDSLRDIYRDDARKVLNAAAKVRERNNGG